MNRPIAAFSMSDYEGLTRNPYQAAEFRRGRDKKKRKRRGALATAGMVAGGLAGAGALAAGARYGGAEISSRMASRYLDNKKGQSQQGYLKARKAAESGGAAGRYLKDREAVSNTLGKVRTNVGNALSTLKSEASRTPKNAAIGYKFGKGSETGIKGIAKGLRGAAEGMSATRLGKASLIGAGLGAAGLAAGAGYGAYRMMNKKKKK